MDVGIQVVLELQYLYLIGRSQSQILGTFSHEVNDIIVVVNKI